MCLLLKINGFNNIDILAEKLKKKKKKKKIVLYLLLFGNR